MAAMPSFSKNEFRALTIAHSKSPIDVDVESLFIKYVSSPSHRDYFRSARILTI